MKTDLGGGPAADDADDADDIADERLERRLSNRFSVELSRAGRDYAALRAEGFGASGSAGRSKRRGMWPRMADSVAALGFVAILLLVVAGLMWRPSAIPGVAPAPSGLVVGFGGIPAQIDGQRVYLVVEQKEWETLSGSFLLGGFAHGDNADCPASVLPSADPEAHLLSRCDRRVELRSDKLPGLVGSVGVFVAPQTSALLYGSEGGPAVVVRVHTHDPEAAQCAADNRVDCETAVVVEAVVWPYVPTEISGEPVYRASDANSFNTLGSTFLLGGVVTVPDLIPPCPAPIDRSAAEQELLPYCTWVAIDGLPVAPKGVAIGDLRNRPVVVRVHVNDQRAAMCPVTVRTDCLGSIVVEAVVWLGEPLAIPTDSLGPTPTPGATGSLNPDVPVTAESSIPWNSETPVDIPTTFNGQPVYRNVDLPAANTFLLGGTITRDPTCAAPTMPQAKPPGCGFWMLDGAKVGTAQQISEELIGQRVVAQMERSRVLAVCPGGSCISDTLVITAILWYSGPVVTVGTSGPLPAPATAPPAP
jgi:hypothetical protein